MPITPDKIHNVVLLGHSSSGKTTLAEQAAYLTGVVSSPGSVEAKNTICDFEPEEKERQMSLQMAVLACPWQQKKFNIIDAPGFTDFIGEVEAALAVAETAVLVVGADQGVEVGTERWFTLSREHDAGLCFFINRLDREGTSFAQSLRQIEEGLGTAIVPAVVPAAEGDVSTFCDLLLRKAFRYEGGKASEVAFPDSDELSAYRERLVEACAEQDDELTEKYLESGSLSDEDLQRGFRSALQQKAFAPVYSGVATTGAGVDLLLSHLARFGLSAQDYVFNKVSGEASKSEGISAEGPFLGIVFKTVSDPYAGRLNFVKILRGKLSAQTALVNARTGNPERFAQFGFPEGKKQAQATEALAGDIVVLSKLSSTLTGDTLAEKDEVAQVAFPPPPDPVYELAVEPKSRGDEEKISQALARLQEEDRSFRVRRPQELHQTLIAGMGDIHLDVILERCRRKYGAAMETTTPKIPYLETITGTAKAQGRYKKQTGGRGQFGDTWLEVKPLERGKGFEFIDKIFGGAIPKNYIPSVEKGVREAMQKGFLAGFPLVDISVTLYDGSYHPVDSSDIAFQIAGSLGFKKCLEQAGVVLLEPIMAMEITAPQDYVGDIISDLNSRRGRVLGTEMQSKYQKIKAHVPLAEVQRYSIDLRSITGGRGHFTMKHSHYEIVPAHLSQKVIEQYKPKED